MTLNMETGKKQKQKWELREREESV